MLLVPGQGAAAGRVAAEGRTPTPPPPATAGVTWEGWQFTWAIHPRERPGLENVSFQGPASSSTPAWQKIFVPYNRGTPRPTDFGDGIAAR